MVQVYENLQIPPTTPSTFLPPPPLLPSSSGIAYCSTYFPFPDGYDTSQMILEWIEEDQAVEVDEIFQMPPPAPLCSPILLSYSIIQCISNLQCTFPDGYDMSQMILEQIEGDEAVEVDENLQMPPTSTFHLSLPSHTLLYQMPQFNTCLSIPDGYVTSQMIMESIGGYFTLKVSKDHNPPPPLFFLPHLTFINSRWL